jgi:hypothetical protein
MNHLNFWERLIRFRTDEPFPKIRDDSWLKQYLQKTDDLAESLTTEVLTLEGQVGNLELRIAALELQRKKQAAYIEVLVNQGALSPTVGREIVAVGARSHRVVIPTWARNGHRSQVAS